MVLAQMLSKITAPAFSGNFIDLKANLSFSSQEL
jgi:hypothetical protein